MSGFFSDNQTKQKAYDRYYNQVARSNFVQGRKLKAMINQEGVDDASTDSLAALFQKAMLKSHDYEYDQITRKLMQKAPAVLSDSKQPKAKSAKATGGIPVNVKGKKKKMKYVPEITDTDILMSPPRSGSSEKNFEQKMSDEEQAPPETHADFINSVVEDELKRKSGTAKPTNFKTVDERIEAYLKKQKVDKSKRVAAARGINKQIEKEIKKRQRDSPANFESPNPRPKKSSKAHISPMLKPMAGKETISEADSAEEKSDDDSFDAGIEEEMKEREYNKKRREEAKLLVSHATTAPTLYNKIRQQFGKEISLILAQRDGKTNPPKNEPYAYFNKEFPKPDKGRDIEKYKKKINSQINAIYLY